MIHISSIPNIGSSSQKMGQLCIHHRRQIFTHDFFDVQTYHLKKLLRSLLNALENLCNFVYRNLQFHGAFSFGFSFLGKKPSKGKAPFLLPFYYRKISHKILYTTSSSISSAGMSWAGWWHPGS